MSDEKNITKLGGWLILVGIGIVISPFLVLFRSLLPFFSLFRDGSWALLTTPGSAAYNPLWMPVLLGEGAINILLILNWIYVGYLFFSKKAIFPKIYIATLLFTLFFIVVDAFLVSIVVPDEPVFNLDVTKDAAKVFISLTIWWPYMYLSKRVKATFVNT